jgi:hypothetical protein
MTGRYLLHTRFLDSDESGCDSDSSMKTVEKKVHFSGSSEDDDSDNSRQSGDRRDYRNTRRPGFNAIKINRGDIPDGSDLFRKVLKEIQTDSEDEVFTPRSRSDSGCSKPLKSILKHKS